MTYLLSTFSFKTHILAASVRRTQLSHISARGSFLLVRGLSCSSRDLEFTFFLCSVPVGLGNKAPSLPQIRIFSVTFPRYAVLCFMTYMFNVSNNYLCFFPSCYVTQPQTSEFSGLDITDSGFSSDCISLSPFTINVKA